MKTCDDGMVGYILCRVLVGSRRAPIPVVEYR